jgi:hypothetical protein
MLKEGLALAGCWCEYPYLWQFLWRQMKDHGETQAWMAAVMMSELLD